MTETQIGTAFEIIQRQNAKPGVCIKHNTDQQDSQSQYSVYFFDGSELKFIKDFGVEQDVIQYVKDLQESSIQQWFTFVSQEERRQNTQNSTLAESKPKGESTQICFIPLPTSSFKLQQSLNITKDTNLQQYDSQIQQLKTLLTENSSQLGQVSQQQVSQTIERQINQQELSNEQKDNLQTWENQIKLYIQQEELIQQHQKLQLSIQKACLSQQIAPQGSNLQQNNNFQNALENNSQSNNLSEVVGKDILKTEAALEQTALQKSLDQSQRNTFTDQKLNLNDDGPYNHKMKLKSQYEQSSEQASGDMMYLTDQSLIKSKRKLSFDNLQRATDKGLPFSPQTQQQHQFYNNNQTVQPTNSLYDMSQLQEGSSQKQRTGKLHLVSFQNEQLLVNGNEVAELKPFGKLVRIGDKIGELCWGLVTNQRGKPLFPNVIIKCNCGCKQILSPQKFSKHANKQYYGKNLMDKIKLVKANKSLGQWLNENWPQGITNEGFQSFQGQALVDQSYNGRSEINTEQDSDNNHSVDNHFMNDDDSSEPKGRDLFNNYPTIQKQVLNAGTPTNARTQQVVQSIVTEQNLKLILSRQITREQASSFFTILSNEEVLQLVGKVDFSVDHYLRVIAKTLNTNEDIQCCISVYGKEGQQRQNHSLGSHARLHLRSRNARAYLQNMKCQPGDIFKVYKDSINNFFVNIERNITQQQNTNVENEQTKQNSSRTSQQQQQQAKNLNNNQIAENGEYKTLSKGNTSFGVPQNVLQGGYNMGEILRNLLPSNIQLGDDQQTNSFGAQYIQNAAILNLLQSQQQNINRQQALQFNLPYSKYMQNNMGTNDNMQQILDSIQRNAQQSQLYSQVEMQQIMQLLQTQEGQQSVLQELQKQKV